MSSFTMTLLGDWVEVELPTDLAEVISILDREVPHFSCEGYGYVLTCGKGTLGVRWDMLVKSVNLRNSERTSSPLGRIELERLDDRTVQLRVPPRSEQRTPEVREFDRDGRLFGSFIYQMLNTLQRRNLIDLPGVLPTV